ncbi:hypothetical protein M6D76_08560 [Alcaligenes faecalis]|uniref:hypothetical protein n=1 Tax=Alcaligenes faecalis TaxID=511 RepID=UPI00211CF503|nr:hypothetical protein [Alcaligenes faecalis]UUO12713.1 hypothetical protein M6D76_08560 [Alcaligenes faecalis]
MTKAEQFLWGVQTALLNNQMILARQLETKDIAEQLAFPSIQRVMDMALKAAACIPREVHVMDAIADFCNVHIEYMWSSEYQPAEWIRGLPG